MNATVADQLAVIGEVDGDHAELARRAAASQRSPRGHLREVLTQHVAVPSMEEWLERVRGLGAVDSGGPTGPDLVAAARDEDDERVAR